MDDLGASSSFTSVSPRVQAVGIKGGRTMGWNNFRKLGYGGPKRSYGFHYHHYHPQKFCFRSHEMSHDIPSFSPSTVVNPESSVENCSATKSIPRRCRCRVKLPLIPLPWWMSSQTVSSPQPLGGNMAGERLEFMGISYWCFLMLSQITGHLRNRSIGGTYHI